MKRTLFITLGIAALIALVLCIIHCLIKPNETEEPETHAISNIVEYGENYMSGTGWSEHANPDSALMNAILMAEEGSPVKPKLTFLMFSNTFNTDSVLATLNSRFSDRKFFGWSIVYNLNVFPDGTTTNNTHSVTAMSLNYPYLKTGIASGNFDTVEYTDQSVINSVKQAYVDAGIKEGSAKPNKIIIISDGESKEIFSLVSAHFNNEVPILGGWIEGDKIANFKKQTHGNNFIIALLFSDKNIAWDFRGGFSLTRHFGQVTKTSDGVIHEINNRSSNEVYSEWCGEKISKYDTALYGFMNYSTLHPIYLKKRVNGVDHYQFMHPGLDEEKNIKVQQHFNIEQGDTVFYAEGKYNLLINHLWKQPEYAIISVPETKISSALVFCCASYPGSIPEEQHPLIAQSLRMSLEKKPWLLTFTNGEHGYISGLGNIYGNLMTGILIFPKP